MSRYKLLNGPDGLALQDTYSRQKPLTIEFSRLERRLRQAGRRSELLVQAVKPRQGLKVMDCTAGLGTDALILAYLGCEVVLVERSRVIASLLDDAIARARTYPSLTNAAGRMRLICTEAASMIENSPLPDLIYIDPMFPVKNGTALVKGGMQLLQKFLGPDRDCLKLLESVLESGVSKTVLKRPPRDSEWSPPRRPDQILESRNAKFEIYLQ